MDEAHAKVEAANAVRTDRIDRDDGVDFCAADLGVLVGCVAHHLDDGATVGKAVPE